MDYEKKYNDALDWIRKVYPSLKGTNKEDAEHYFPELIENEDEKKIGGLYTAILLLRDLVHAGKLQSTDKYRVEKYYEELASWVKSLPKSHWKPSAEQLVTLKHVALYNTYNIASKEVLLSLYKELIKL